MHGLMLMVEGAVDHVELLPARERDEVHGAARFCRLPFAGTVR